jgi:hypothetical protein
MGDMYIATIPRCPTHGKMEWIHPVDVSNVFTGDSYWICHGFDGEGCGHRVEEADMGWTAVNDSAFKINMVTGDAIYLRTDGELE